MVEFSRWFNLCVIVGRVGVSSSRVFRSLIFGVGLGLGFSGDSGKEIWGLFFEFLGVKD